jgi:hypothetical protein
VVVIASEYLASGFAARARRNDSCLRDYQQLQVTRSSRSRASTSRSS